MKQSRVLNRPMFNRHNSAYGRGIASNLVTEEQRVRYNAGGRVGLKYGSGYLMKIPGVSKVVNKLFPKGSSYAKFYDKYIAPKGSTVGGYGGTKWGAGEVPIAKSLYGKGAGIVKGIGENIRKYPGVWGTGVLGGGSLFFGGDEEETIGKGTKVDPKWAKKLKGKPVEVEEKAEEVIDWTPKEKEEKKRDVALAMAERLIGGSRDKWGGTAQMKNLAGAIGDVRKITDKEDLRKDERKYKAWAKANEKLIKTQHELANNYKAMLGKGLNHQAALTATTGITGTLNRAADKKQQKEDDKAIGAQGPGTVFFDEEKNSWQIFTPDGNSVTVTIDQIQEAYKSGAIDEMRKKPPEEKEIETTSIDIDKGPVTQAGAKGTIPFDPENPQVLGGGMPFFNKFDF